MGRRIGRRSSLLLAVSLLTSAAPLAAQQPMTPDQAYVAYLKAVHGGGPSDVEAFLGAEALAQLKALPESARGKAVFGLQMPGLTEPPRTVKVENVRDHVVLHLAGSVDLQRAYTGTAGTPIAVTGKVEMARQGSGWTIVSERWEEAGKPHWSGLISPGVFPQELLGSPLEWATGDIRSVVSAEAAYQSANFGYYGPMTCLAQPAACLSGSTFPSFLKTEVTSLATRNGFRRRFDEGARAPAKDVGAGKASRSSIASYAYWIIPDPPTPGSKARCGDASGVICEPPDGQAVPTKGECPKGCLPIP